jgi:hypothetical protein
MTGVSDSDDDAWESVAINPNPATDLGYEYEPLTAIHADDDRYIFLPGEDDHLTDAEFLIADPEDVCRLADWR